MKSNYRGHRLIAERDKSMMGDEMIYFAIIREEDGFVVEDSFTYAEGTSVRETISHLKERVDNEIRDQEKESTKGETP